MCSLTFILLSVSPGYHLLLITTFVFSNICDVVCVSRLSVNLDYPSVSLTFMMLSVSPGYILLLITPSVSLTFMMSSVSPGYHLLLITPSVFSNVCDVVCVPRLSVTLDYPFDFL
jgi:DsbC/DsbD-like thiol-disulfide interchange protein